MSDSHEQLRNLLGLYCERMDAGDFAGLADLFSAARLADEHGAVFAKGRNEALAMWQAQTILYAGSPRTRHITANPVIDVDEKAGTAQVRSSYIVFQATDGFALQPIAGGRYADEFVRADDGTWRFAERRYSLDHVGDLSHHLRGS